MIMRCFALVVLGCVVGCGGVTPPSEASGSSGSGGAAGGASSSGSGGADSCLPAGPVVHSGPVEIGSTCDKSYDLCGVLKTLDGNTIDCGCGNTMNVCDDGWCVCTPASEPAACDACPGKVARYCGEYSRKTQQGCHPSTTEIGGNLVSCCDS